MRFGCRSCADAEKIFELVFPGARWTKKPLDGTGDEGAREKALGKYLQAAGRVGDRVRSSLSQGFQSALCDLLRRLQFALIPFPTAGDMAELRLGWPGA